MENHKVGLLQTLKTFIERQKVSEAELWQQWGVKISLRSINLVNITVEEAIHIQRYPMLNGPNPALTRRLWDKLADPGNWRIVVREPQQLSIEVHSIFYREDSSVSDTEASNSLLFQSKFDVWSVLLLPETAKRVLIAGSMEGAEPILFRTLRPDREYHTLDILPENAAILGQLGFLACVADIHSLPYAPESFDAVYNNNVMEHLYNDVDACFRGILEILRPGGVLYSVIPTEMNSTNPDADWQMEYVGNSYNWWLVDPCHPWKTDLHDIQARLLAAGFERPTFAYFNEHLEQCAAKRQRRCSNGPISWLQRVFEAFEESISIQRVESQIRDATGFYRYLGFRRRLRDLLRLPNRQQEVLQVAVLANKPNRH